MKPYLTAAEITEITEPLTQGAARIKFFRRLGVKAEPRPNGQPLVWRADFYAARVASVPAANDSPGARTRDWAAFEERVRYGRGSKEKRRQPAGA